jgi:hypothetical protein
MNSSEVKCETSGPVLLNCWKHHAGFIKSKVIQYKKNPERNSLALTQEIISIGESLMDLYTGELTPQEIADEVLHQLEKEQASGMREYGAWLKQEGKGYKIIKLADLSQWTLRLGERKTKYVHIHPSRYSLHTIRARSASLKTAILFSISQSDETENKLILINRIRKEYLNLPQLKNINSASAMLRLTALLS